MLVILQYLRANIYADELEIILFENNIDPTQLTSYDAIWSGSTLFYFTCTCMDINGILRAR